MRPKGRTLATLALLGAALSAAAGCSPWSTYPPVEVSAAQKLTRPTFEPVPTVMATAIRYARSTYLEGREVAINLPRGAPAEAYDKVFAKLDAEGGGGRPMTVPGEPALHIVEVRTRAMDAQVDLIYPRADGLNQFVTLTLRREVFEDWRVKSARPWRLRNVELPQPNYVPPPATDEKPAS